MPSVLLCHPSVRFADRASVVRVKSPAVRPSGTGLASDRPASDRPSSICPAVLLTVRHPSVFRATDPSAPRAWKSLPTSGLSNGIVPVSRVYLRIYGLVPWFAKFSSTEQLQRRRSGTVAKSCTGRQAAAARAHAHDDAHAPDIDRRPAIQLLEHLKFSGEGRVPFRAPRRHALRSIMAHACSTYGTQQR